MRRTDANATHLGRVAPPLAPPIAQATKQTKRLPQEVLAQLAAPRSHTAPELEQTLQTVSRQKLAYDRAEFHLGVSGIATYVHTHNQHPIAIGIVIATARRDTKLPTLQQHLLSVRDELRRAVEAM